ncbi:MAG: 8-amino-7-oxononanoate synthase [Deltaproteobacteria bacterium]|nr:MAG: 8-amino-7-oxononanoate synthase [Deltaproteobacteria bacterium]
MTHAMDDELRDDLNALAGRGLRRNARTVASAHGPTIRVDGHEVLSLSSNDYLGFSRHPDLADALHRGAQAHGVGTGGSRLISGTHEKHLAVEQRLARFVGTEDALLFSTGYAANVGVLTALTDSRDVIFSDALNHASLIDGCRLSKATVHVFPHGDVDALAALLRAQRKTHRRALIATDAVFSMDGDCAPLAALRAVATEHDAWLFVDEAHALGVLGPEGRGLSRELGVTPEIRMGTLGKAFGVSGAFVAGSRALTEVLRNRARSFVFSTAPSPALAEAILVATDLVEAADDRRGRVLGHAARLRRELSSLGYEVPGGGTPIVPVLTGTPEATMAMARRLFEAGIFAHGIRPPTVAKGTSRIRVVPMALHTDDEIQRVISVFAELRRAPQQSARP